MLLNVLKQCRSQFQQILDVTYYVRASNSPTIAELMSYTLSNGDSLTPVHQLTDLGITEHLTCLGQHISAPLPARHGQRLSGCSASSK